MAEQNPVPKHNLNLMDGGTKVRSFPYKFTEKEVSEIAKNAANTFQKIKAAEDEKKAIIKQHDEKIQILKNEHSLLNNKVISGIEQRDFKCSIQLDFATGRKYFTEFINGAHLGDFPLDADDYQVKANFDIAENKKQIAEKKLADENSTELVDKLLDSPLDNSEQSISEKIAEETNFTNSSEPEKLSLPNNTSNKKRSSKKSEKFEKALSENLIPEDKFHEEDLKETTQTEENTGTLDEVVEM